MASFIVPVLTGNSDIRFFLVLCVALVMLTIFVASVRCRVCGELVMWWGMKQRNMFRALDELRACPDCGARNNDDKLV